MPPRGGKRGPRGGGGGGGKRPRGGDGGNYWITGQDKQNDAFEEYYKTQDIVPEGEWEPFIQCLRRPLPVTFRINGSGRFADHLRDKLQSDFFSHFGDGTLVVDGEPVSPPRPLPWYPNNYAWHMDFSRGQLRKMPLLEQIHSFMVKANDAGSISRQEAVSMVPPLFLDVRPMHKVLDMCAAPGSKTFQLLEALHAGPEPPTGYVIANDADFNRCSLLTHQTKRVCSPCLMVTNHSAEYFPALKGPDGMPVRFDRILCDVPCSGDGTMRKAPDIWKRWGVGGGNGLHIMQLRIALQGCKLLEVGGRMVYSTCTFNPIEDEAVVAEILRVCGGAVELVDVSDHLPALKRLPGKHTWRVRDKFKWYDSWEDAKDTGFKLDPSMFPTPEKSALPLERCMRFLPHHQDTGGFFVCVLRKVAELPDFELPTPYRPALVAGQKPSKSTALPEMDDPLAAARDAAAAAIAAAEAAVTAAAAGDVSGTVMSSQQASVAAGRAQLALEVSKRALHKAARGASGRAADEDEEAGAGEDGEDGEGPAAMEEDGEEGAGPSSAQPAAEEAEEGAEGEKEKEGGQAVKQGAKGPSWVRGGGGRGRSDGGKHRYIDPITPVEDPEILKPLREYYGYDAAFPLETQLIARSMDSARPKRLYFVNRPLLDLLLLDEGEQLKIIATGLKVFERQEIKEEGEEAVSLCSYRVAQEGLPLLLPHTSKQRVELATSDFLTLLKDRVLLMPNSQQLAKEAEGAEPKAAPAEGGKGGKVAHHGVKRTPITDAKLLADIEALRAGCVVCELRPSDALDLGLVPTGAEAASALTAYAPMALSAWKGKASLAIMVDKNETVQMIDKIEGAMKRKRADDAAAAQKSS